MTDLMIRMKELVNVHVKVFAEDLDKDFKYLASSKYKNFYWLIRKCGTVLVPANEFIYYKDTSENIVLKYYTSEFFKDVQVYKISTLNKDRGIYGSIEKISTKSFANSVREKSFEMQEEHMVKYLHDALDKFKDDSLEEAISYAKSFFREHNYDNQFFINRIKRCKSINDVLDLIDSQCNIKRAI